MKNKLPDLQNHLFEMMERIMDEDMEDEKLKKELERAIVFNDLARTAVANGALMSKCVDLLYGIPVSDEIPLLPKADNETFIVDGKKSALLRVPRDDGCGGFKRNRQNPI
jgi:hypothetical protein